jgi:hypothetical protein
MSIYKKDDRINVINISVVLTLCLSVFLRVFELDNIPGINGDEAWYGLVGLRLLEGELPALTTPAGNILNPFYILPVTAFHLAFEPSFFLLRLTALLSGLLLMVLSYYFSKKIFNEKIALIVLLITAALPVNIVYSRLGWDTSQTVLASCVVVYALLCQRWVLLGFALCAGVLIHPTNIALFVIAVLYIVIDKIFASNYPAAKKIVSVGSMSLLLLGLYFVIDNSSMRGWLPAINVIMTRAMDLPGAGEFILNVSKLFSGTTVYQYVSGADTSVFGKATDIMLAFGLIALLLFLLPGAYRRKDKTAFSFVLSLLMMLVAWYLFFSSFTLVPGRERYSLFLIMPMVICLGFFCIQLMKHIKYEKMLLVSLIGSNLLMAGFINSYFVQFYKTGGQSEQTFRTSHVEPKKLVFDKLLELTENKETIILASDWWNSQPLMYLAYNLENLNVINMITPGGVRISEDETVYINTFTGDEVDSIVNNQLTAAVNNAWVFKTYSGEPLMMLYQMKPLEMEIRLE